MSLTKQAAELLGNDKATAAELQESHSRHRTRRVEVETRLKAITRADKSGWGGGPGPERRKAEAAGDVDLVKKLDDEEGEIVAELSVLHSQEKQLREKLDQAVARENIQSASDEYGELDGELSEVFRLRADLQKAMQAVEQRLQSIRGKRAHNNRLRMSYPAADAALMQRYMQAHGYQYSENHLRQGWFAPGGGNPRSLQMVSDALGIESPGNPANEPQSESEAKLGACNA